MRDNQPLPVQTVVTITTLILCILAMFDCMASKISGVIRLITTVGTGQEFTLSFPTACFHHSSWSSRIFNAIRNTFIGSVVCIRAGREETIVFSATLHGAIGSLLLFILHGVHQPSVLI